MAINPVTITTILTAVLATVSLSSVALAQKTLHRADVDPAAFTDVLGMATEAGRIGVIGSNPDDSAFGFLAGADLAFSQHAGVYGQSDHQGVIGLSTSATGTGVYGGSTAVGGGAGIGVRGETSTGVGIQGRSFGTGLAGRFIGSVAVTGDMHLDGQGNVSFGAQTRQMINLFDVTYGIGVQASALYQRTDGDFLWYNGGTHRDQFLDAGGGKLLMRLGNSGDLTITRSIVTPILQITGGSDVAEPFKMARGEIPSGSGRHHR